MTSGDAVDGEAFAGDGREIFNDSHCVRTVCRLQRLGLSQAAGQLVQPCVATAFTQASAVPKMTTGCVFSVKRFVLEI